MHAMPAPAGSGGSSSSSTGWPREREEYAARRALFLQTYRFSTPAPGLNEEDEGLRGRVARRLREARVAGRGALARACGAARWWLGAGLARAWRARRQRPVLRRFGGSPGPSRNKYYCLHGFA